MPKFYSCAPQADNPTKCVGIVDISSSQYEFIQLVAQCSGDLNEAFGLMPCSPGCKQEWAKDPIFWPAVRALQAQIARAKHLNEDFVKDKMVAAVNGEFPITKQQMQAINLSARVLGMGLAQNQTRSRVDIQPDRITVEFSDGPPQSLPAPDASFSQPQLEEPKP